MSTMPTTPGPRTSKIASLVQNVLNVTHSLRRVVSTRGGQRWRISLSFAPATRDEITDLWAFLNAQSGQAGAFYYTLPNHAARGTIAGAPVVDGADQAGKDLATKGWPANSAGVLRVGDFIRLDGHFKTYQVTADVSADAAGKAVISLFPALQNAPFDAAAVVADCRFRCSLYSDISEMDISVALHYGTSFELVEVLT